MYLTRNHKDCVNYQFLFPFPISHYLSQKFTVLVFPLKCSIIASQKKELKTHRHFPKSREFTATVVPQVQAQQAHCKPAFSDCRDKTQKFSFASWMLLFLLQYLDQISCISM